MAILHIKSANDNLSFVLQKNPASGMFVKSNKQGCLFGFFPKTNGEVVTNEYVVYFKDASDKITYKRHPDEQFEYLNASKYNDARFINDAIQEVLHAAREGKGDSKVYDTVTNHTIKISLVETNFKTIDIFRRYFPTIAMNSEEISNDNYRMEFVTLEPTTLQYLLQVINLFSIFAQLNSPTYSYLTEDLVKKYVRIANEVDAPYFIKYLIKIRMCRAEGIFESVKADLETSNRYAIQMQHGDTHDNRIQWIKNILAEPEVKGSRPTWTLDRSIVDIGTGIDYRYLKILAPKLKDTGLTYHAIEIDHDARERIKAGLVNRGLEDVVDIYESLDEFIKYHNEYLNKETFDVLCTEVLEHNEFDVAKSIIKQVTKNINYNRFIVTVPNAAFNKFYGLDGFRHDDHKWEANDGDIAKLVGNLNHEISPVGDIVDNIPVTIGIVITQKVYS